ncbi:hypothetical protein AMTRI_Chr06g198430 [Amborella trichopoda]
MRKPYFGWSDSYTFDSHENINVISKLNFKPSTWDFQNVKFHILYNHQRANALNNQIRTHLQIVSRNMVSILKSFMIALNYIFIFSYKNEKAQLPGKRVKALLRTNPSNPLGQTLKASTLHQILDFLSIKKIVFNPSSPFVIASLRIMSKNTNPRIIHIVYSLSKDLGVPGFRVGAICSQNDEILTTSRRIMLLDMECMRRYMVMSKKRLRERHERLVGGLREMGIECLEGGSGFFALGEMRLWEVVLKYVGLNVCPGSSFHHEEPGWFRVCFGNMNLMALDVALQRIRDYFIVHGKRVEGVGCSLHIDVSICFCID